MAYTVSSSGYPTSPLERFVTGVSEGFETGTKLAKQYGETKSLFEAKDAQEAAASADKLAKTFEEKGTEVALEPSYADTVKKRDTDTDTGGGGYTTGSAKLKDGELYDYLVEQGATKNEAAMLTSAAGAESGFDPDLTHDGGIGYGLFGHNKERLEAMRKSAGVGPRDLIPWQKQAVFSLNELRGRPEGKEVNSATTAEQLLGVQRRYEGYKLGGPTAHEDRRLASTAKYMGDRSTWGQTQTASAGDGAGTTAAPTTMTEPATPSAGGALQPSTYQLPSEKSGGISGQLGGAPTTTSYGTSGYGAPAQQATAPTTGIKREPDALDLSGPSGPTQRSAIKPQASYAPALAPTGQTSSSPTMALSTQGLLNRPQAPPPPSTLTHLAQVWPSINPIQGGRTDMALIPAKSGLYA